MFGNGLRKIASGPQREPGAQPGTKLSQCFSGKTTHHSSLIACIGGARDLKALWHAAQQNPEKMRSVEGLPFAWEEGGVTYRSDCLAFEKNMTLLADAVETWNSAVAQYEGLDPRTFVNDYARPVVKNLNHLISGGGLGDFQSPPRESILLPKSHSKEYASNLRNGFIALSWDKSAESLQGKNPSKASLWKLEASKAAAGANMGLTKSWAQARLIEAGASAGLACKEETEANPCKDHCSHGIQIYDATLAAIGWGVGCLAKVDKYKLFQDRNVLVNDMNVVYEQKNFDPKKLKKTPLQTLLGKTEPEKKMEWMTSTEWIDEKDKKKILLS